MKLIVFGVNHKTAPVSLRERVSFAPEKMGDAMLALNFFPGVKSNLIISTCNRTEIYLGIDNKVYDNNSNDFVLPDNEQVLTMTPLKIEGQVINNNLVHQLINWLSDYHKVNLNLLLEHLFMHVDKEAVRHLMRVASGLDSLVLGEPQILGQVKDAYQLAQETYKIAPRFSRWIEKSFTVAKRVRTETDIGANAVSVAFAACSLAKQIFENLSELNVLLIGAGETIELVSRHLKTQGVNKLVITNRTRSRAELLASQVGANVFDLENISAEIHQADIIISSTASPIPLVTHSMMKSSLRKRRYQPVLLIDIAVPRDIEESVSELDSVYLYSVDDLQNIITNNQSQRLSAAKTAEILIQEEVDSFFAWINTQSATEAITRYRDSAEIIRAELLAKAISAIDNGSDPIEELQRLSKKLTNKLIHNPTIALKNSTLHENKAYFNQLTKDLKLTPP